MARHAEWKLFKCCLRRAHCASYSEDRAAEKCTSSPEQRCERKAQCWQLASSVPSHRHEAGGGVGEDGACPPHHLDLRAAGQERGGELSLAETGMRGIRTAAASVWGSKPISIGPAGRK